MDLLWNELARYFYNLHTEYKYIFSYNLSHLLTNRFR